MSNWTCIDIEPQPDGYVGGDGAQESVSVRFHHSSGKAAVTVYTYVVDLTERGYDDEDTLERPWRVEEMVEFIIFTDPEDIGGTEVWSTTEYTPDVSAYDYADLADADEVAEQNALQWIAMGVSHFIAWEPSEQDLAIAV